MVVHGEFSSLGCDIVLPNPHGDSHIYPMCSQPSFWPRYCFHMPIDNLMIYDATIGLGYKDKMIAVLGRNTDHFVSRGYFSRHDAFHDAYCICLVEKPRKIM